MNVKLILNQSYLYRYLSAIVHKIVVRINPRMEINRCYNTIFHHLPNLENPQNLLEKIYWMQLYSDTSQWTLCADKYRMREYVSSIGLQDYLPILHGKWDNPKDIDFSTLPKSFVLKANNGCGTVYVVNDKEEIDPKKVKKMLRQWLSIPFGYSGYQKHYLSIKPCIIAEELLRQNSNYDKLSPESMVDFKVWCINANPECILVVYGRRGHHYCLDLYDTQWNRMMDKMRPFDGCEYRESPVPKPQCLSQMLEMAALLSKPFQEVRVDFYVVGGRPIIGELTFTTGYGYFTEDFYQYLGSKIDLSKVKKVEK